MKKFIIGETCNGLYLVKWEYGNSFAIIWCSLEEIKKYNLLGFAKENIKLNFSQ